MYNAKHMESLYLDLRDKTAMAGFLQHWSDLADDEVRGQAEDIVRSLDQGEELSAGEVAEAVSEFARDVWPARYALARFFNKEGALIEWDTVVKAVRRSTAQLMLRFRDTAGFEGLDEMLEHADLDTVLRDEEVHEIQEVRHHVCEDYYRSHKKQLVPLMDEARRLLSVFDGKISELRHTAEGLPALLQEELYSKITRYEDRVLYAGGYVPSETLDEELKYYREQEALPI